MRVKCVFLLSSLWLMVDAAEVSTAAETIDSFDECAQAGHPIMESHPRQCRAPDGRVFVETVQRSCENLCGDGTCQKIVCMAIGCPCSESSASCPDDCSR